MVEPGRILVLPLSFVSNIETIFWLRENFYFFRTYVFLSHPILYVYVVFRFLCHICVKVLSSLCHIIVTVLSRNVMLYATYLKYLFGLFGYLVKYVGFSGKIPVFNQESPFFVERPIYLFEKECILLLYTILLQKNITIS